MDCRASETVSDRAELRLNLAAAGEAVVEGPASENGAALPRDRCRRFAAEPSELMLAPVWKEACCSDDGRCGCGCGCSDMMIDVI